MASTSNSCWLTFVREWNMMAIRNPAPVAQSHDHTCRTPMPRTHVYTGRVYDVQDAVNVVQTIELPVRVAARHVQLVEGKRRQRDHKLVQLRRDIGNLARMHLPQTSGTDVRPRAHSPCGPPRSRQTQNTHRCIAAPHWPSPAPVATVDTNGCADISSGPATLEAARGSSRSRTCDYRGWRAPRNPPPAGSRVR